MVQKVVILTGSELRHQYFRKKIAVDPQIEVLASYCEDDSRSLLNRVESNPNSSQLERQHVQARTQSETDFFLETTNALDDLTKPIKIEKGAINSETIVNDIVALKPTLLICYGSSLIKSKLLEIFKGRFINVHLGLSPYYKGSGTNIWPLINEQPYMVGATFMHIDEGIDTGRIIHQIRPKILLGDSPHSLGNRLIRDMTEAYSELVKKFSMLEDETQPETEGVTYFIRDFDSSACEKLYAKFSEGLIEKYLNRRDSIEHPYIVQNRGITISS